MIQKPSGSPWPLVLVATLLATLASSDLYASEPPIFAVSTFQASVPATSPGPCGTATLEEKGSNQIFSVTINNLGGDASGGSGSFGVFVGSANTTNAPVYLVGPLGLQGTNDTWTLRYEANGMAPLQLGVTNMSDLVGQFLFIANPGYTNVVNGVTNEIVNSVLFARIPAFTTMADAPRYHRKAPLTVPSIAPPNPAEKGWVMTMFNGAQGRSVLQLSATHLSGGGTYSIFIEDPPASSNMTDIGLLMISTNNAQSGSYTIDTRQGETLPLEAPTVRDLSDRAIQIRDAFGEIHLEGTIP